MADFTGGRKNQKNQIVHFEQNGKKRIRLEVNHEENPKLETRKTAKKRSKVRLATPEDFIEPVLTGDKIFGSRSR